MKNIFKLLMLGLLSFFVFSCEKDEDMAVASLKSNAILAADQTSLVLAMATGDQTAINYTWSNPDYGVAVSFTNQLQFAVQGTNFASPKTVDVDAGSTKVTFTQQQLNSYLLSLGLATNVAANVEVRLKSALGSAVTYSNIKNLTVTPYALVSYMYAPGGYQGWSPTTANTLVSATSNGIYVGFVNFLSTVNDGLKFKITPETNWNNSYGSSSAFSSSVTTIPVLYNGGSDITAPGTGYYRLTLNSNDNTLNAIPYQLSIIGSATTGGNWSTDFDMTWNNSLLKWTYTGTFLSGEFKFRLNHDWNQTNWGGSGGQASTGGGNIAVSAGTHTILLDPYDLTYSIN